MEKLIKRRATIKASLDRIEDFTIKNEINKVIDVHEFVIREECLVKTFEEYRTVQDLIEEKNSDENSDRDDFETRFFTVSAKLRSIVKGHLKDEVKASPVGDSGVSQHLPFRNVGGGQAVKLPNLNIPVFHGQYEEWKSFFDIFSALIDSDTKLSDVQKFLYLKTALKGEPLDLIDDLRVTNENYKSALEILTNRYNNKLSIINSHIKTLLEIPSLHKVSCSVLRDFLTTIRKHVSALVSLEVPVDSWDMILVYIFAHKLDFGTHRAYELEKESSTDLPKLKEFLEFLDKRCLALERVSSSNEKVKSVKAVSHFSSGKSHENSTSQRYFCVYCKYTNHNINKCIRFNKLAISDRKSFASNSKLCFNCLGDKHLVSQCKAKKCSECSGRHHTLLHDNKFAKSQTIGSQNVSGDKQCRPESPSEKIVTTQDENMQTSCMHGCKLGSEVKTVLLATARIVLTSRAGKQLICRALLDNGSMNSFITTQTLKKLNAPVVSHNMEIGGLGDHKIKADKQVNLFIRSLTDRHFFLEANCTVLDRITCPLPQTKIDIDRLKINDIQLSDPEFFISSEIDMLIGSDIYYEIIQPGLIKLGKNLPTVQNTSFGWVIFGPLVETRSVTNLSVSLVSHSLSVDDLIPKFWQLEELQYDKSLSNEDKMSESIFEQTTKRLADGRFQVNLPIKDSKDLLKLGESYDFARRRFISLEKRLVKNQDLYKDYRNFIDEYVRLNHARYVPLDLSNDIIKKNFFPHFCVIREQAQSTRLRVVFDSSMKTTTLVSLNDILLKGYTVQPELFDILCRFRCYQYVLIADIQKMFRQIRINPSQTHLQNILWRDNPQEPIKCIELSTVTYGTNCAPFLATRCLVQLARENSLKYPLASKTLLEQCYVDDILGGSDSQEKHLQLYRELMSLLSSAGFSLHKWHTNDESLSKMIPSCTKENTEVSLSENCNSTKVLGLLWNSAEDSFRISCSQPVYHDKVTKRAVLSNIAQMYDPLGLISPVIVSGKILMQKVWASGIGWDDVLPPVLLEAWKQICLSLNRIMELQIPRCLLSLANYVEIQLIGFSDSSQSAYGVCVYLRVKYHDNTISSRLICSKSRVAPLKAVSIPRLELCASLLLARLIHKLKNIFSLSINGIYLYTDSEIVLHWLKGTSSQWTTFVANRVAEIQELTVNCVWSHIPSKKNPADHVSRGMNPEELLNCDLWWKGPAFLEDPHSVMPVHKTEPEILTEDIPEQRKSVCNVHISSSSLFSRFSKFTTLQRTIAYCLRFVNNCSMSTEKITDSCLSVKEIQSALDTIIKCTQMEFFSSELKCLNEKRNLRRDSVILNLNPFIDQKGILRVGGRIQNAEVSYAQKHPIILPNKSHVVMLLIKREHEILGHAGVHTVLSNLRLKYWPVSALKMTKKVINDCVICHRFKANFSEQLMGSLPPERVACVRPFYNVGVDFAGPVMVRESKLRKARISKAYISLFVCMNTKAIHIELVSDLSTDNFLLCLKRFISRRGMPSKIFSDNATNFQGANNNLRELYQFFRDKKSSQIYDYLSSRQCQWTFIPPSSPHWGGLWESGVKSMKFHIKRVIGKSVLTFEQLTTVLCQIESILNSRPLIPNSNNIDDFTCLTPGHFLVGEPLSCMPEKDVKGVPDSRLSDYKLVSKMRQHFWQRWVLEYLNRLQHRPKWMSSKNDLKPNMMVVLKEDNVPPLQWPLARIVSVTPGVDGKVRVVSVKTPRGTFTRPITKVSPLPFELVEE